MQTLLFWFGLVANTITVVAGLIAVAGVVWAFRGRAKLAVTQPFPHPSLAPSLTLVITSVGSSPVRDLELNYGTLTENNFSMMGGDFGSRAVLSRGDTILVTAYEAAELSFGSAARAGEFRVEIQPGEGFYLNVQWQSPLFPWRRVSRTYAWPPKRRFANELAEELKGRAEIEFLKGSRSPELNPLLPGFVAPRESRPTVVIATDDTFDELVRSHRGTVLVGFGPTWQGKWWEDVKRMLGALAAKHPRLRVLAVNTDECPELSRRFDANLVPIFRILKDDEVQKSYTGAHTLPDLEREFAEFLSR